MFDIAAFVLAVTLFFGISGLKARLLAARPFGLPPGAAPYVAYATVFAALGVGMGWRAVHLERSQSRHPVEARRLFATCVVGCVLLGVCAAWLLG